MAIPSLLISEWKSEIKNITEDYKDAFGKLSAEELNWKPNSITWSIGHNIDHVIRINESYFPILKQLKDGNYHTSILGKFPFVTSLLGNFVLKAVAPDRRKKTKTFTIWEPSESHIDKDIISKFEKHQHELIHQMEQSEYLIKKRTVISSPANKNIVYTLEKAFEIIITHEKRHYNQASELLVLMK